MYIELECSIVWCKKRIHICYCIQYYFYQPIISQYIRDDYLPNDEFDNLIVAVEFLYSYLAKLNGQCQV